jgi:membrane protease YdiL (CAAX protease family)
LRIILKCFAYYILAMIVFVSLKLCLNQIFDDYFNPKFEKTLFKTLSWAILPLIININVFTPIIEEFGFRFPILGNRKKVFTGILVYFIVFPIFAHSKFGSQDYWIIFSIGIFYYLFIFFLQFKNPTLTLFFSAFIFGTAHLVNFPELSTGTLFSCWFNVIPQMISGVILAKLRISKGVDYAIYFHMLLNLFATFLQICRN